MECSIKILFYEITQHTILCVISNNLPYLQAKALGEGVYVYTYTLHIHRQSAVIHSQSAVIHRQSAVCLTTGQEPLPQRILQ